MEEVSQLAKITTLKVDGFYEAILGMRNPFKTRLSSDSGEDYIGDDDMRLMKTLLSSKFECDAKFMRMITVWADFKMPRYYFSEFDTYHWNSKNSESTMHTLMSKDGEFTLDMFEDCDSDFVKYSLLKTCEDLNLLRKIYQDAKEKRDSKTMAETIRDAKMILPESFLQMRTVCTNYAELRHMYAQRHNHRLPEWNTVFVEWVKTLPYSELITEDYRATH